MDRAGKARPVQGVLTAPKTLVRRGRGAGPGPGLNPRRPARKIAEKSYAEIVVSEYQPSGDQPQAALAEGIENGR